MTKILRAVFISYFGNGAPRPARTALLRLCSLFALAVASAFYGVKGIADFPLSPWAHPATVAMCSTAVMQGAVLIALLSAQGILNSRSTITSLLIYLPIGRHKAWLLSVLPHLILTCLIVVMVGPVIVIGAKMLGLNWLWAMLLVCIGGLSGLGVAQIIGAGGRNMGVAARTVVVIGVEAAALYGFRTAGLSGLPLAAVQGAVALGVAYGLYGLYFGRRNFARDYTVPPTTKMVQPNPFSALWFLTKSARNPGMRLSLISACAISVACSIAIRHSPAQDPAMTATVAALLGAASVSDIRAMSRQYNPAEITALRGTMRYMLDTLQANALCVLACCPLLYLLFIQQLPAASLLLYVAYFFVGISAGNAIGAIIAPRNKDISAQFFGVFISAFVLWIPFQVPSFTTANTWWQVGTLLVMGIAFSGLGLAA